MYFLWAKKKKNNTPQLLCVDLAMADFFSGSFQCQDLWSFIDDDDVDDKNTVCCAAPDSKHTPHFTFRPSESVYFA